MFRRGDGVGELWCRELFLWSAVRGSGATNGCSLCSALSIDVVKRLTVCVTHCVSLARRKCDAAALQAGLPRSTAASRRTRPFARVSQSNRTKKRMQLQVQNRAGLGQACISCSHLKSLLLCTSALIRIADKRRDLCWCRIFTRCNGSWPREPQSEITPAVCEQHKACDAQPQPWRRAEPCASWPSSPRREPCNRR